MGKSTIAIIGAGILGSAIAAELTSDGHTVQVYSNDASSALATPNSFGWINAHGPENAHHFKMRLESMRLWKELKAVHPSMPAEHITAIDWDLPQDQIISVHKHCSQLNHSTELLTNSDLRSRFPDLQCTAKSTIVSTHDMVADPEKIAGFFQTLANACGATFVSHRTVDGLSSTGDGITVNLGGEMQAFDHLVIAAGTGSAALLKPLGYELPMTNRKGVLFRSEPQSTKLNYLINAPDFHCWQLPDGSLIAGSAQAGCDPQQDLEKMRQHLTNSLESLVPKFGKVSFTSHTIGKRPQPTDGMPVIDLAGNHENLHVAVMHSGITLAPYAAKAIAQQVKTGKPPEELAPYSLERFQPMQEKIAV